MASTSQLLTWIELECHGWTREGPRGSRALFNEAHRMFYTHPTAQRIVWDDSTGNLPYVKTKDGKYKYDAPDNVWLVEDILIDAATDLGYDTSNLNIEWKAEPKTVAGAPYYRIINIRTHPSTPSNNAWYRFVGMNPGKTSDTFRLLGYQKPVEIESDTIQHEMPDGLDIQYLMPATIKLIEGINDHEKLDNARLYIEQVLKPRFWSEADRGMQGQSFFVKRRPA